MTPAPDPRMGDAHEATHDDGHCDCSIHNARELYALVSALAADKGIDLDDPHDMGDGGEDDDHGMDLRLIADLAIAHGAEPGMDDEPDDDGDEMDVSRFSDDEDDGGEGGGDIDDDDDEGDSDLDDEDDLDLDIIDLDDDDTDEYPTSFSDEPARMSDDLVTTPAFDF